MVVRSFAGIGLAGRDDVSEEQCQGHFDERGRIIRSVAPRRNARHWLRPTTGTAPSSTPSKNCPRHLSRGGGVASCETAPSPRRFAGGFFIGKSLASIIIRKFSRTRVNSPT